MNRIAMIAAGALLLAGCQDEAAEVAADDGGQTAEGEVLGGTISDDMLPLATQTSQAPPLRQETGDDSPSASSGSDAAEPASDSESEASPAAPAEPAASAEDAGTDDEA
ncbi:hypothetical protein K3179_02755 [Qipengyuania sp. GH38]|uniref:hypothetical protein n=1 Tax=Qipengyuania intermedia TaxID=2867244 RepID=UPI001C8811E5|nr:hypothetical protein [Qipengyuania intermedia]MBX7513461.1 hypothetical protein [Qipengyuania intermedia]